jgi:hypothetical protein
MKITKEMSKIKRFFGRLSGYTASIVRTAEARQRYQEYLDRFPWGEHAPEALAALERLGA